MHIFPYFSVIFSKKPLEKSRNNLFNVSTIYVQFPIENFKHSYGKNTIVNPIHFMYLFKFRYNYVYKTRERITIIYILLEIIQSGS